MSETSATIYKKLVDLEQQVQRMKVQTYFQLPKRQRAASRYSQASIGKALRATRNGIWREKYAKKIKSLS